VATAITIELPAMIRAFDAVTFYLATGQRSAAMSASVAQTMSDAISVAEQNKVLADHASLYGFVGEFGAHAGWVPEIDKHLILPLEIRAYGTDSSRHPD
jgi:hypothetical protein